MRRAGPASCNWRPHCWAPGAVARACQESGADALTAINTVRGVESGADVKVSTVLRLCSVLDVQLGDLFGGV